MFSSGSFMVSGLRFKSFIHFQLTFIYKYRSDFILLHVNIQFFSIQSIEETTLLHYIFFYFLYRICTIYFSSFAYFTHYIFFIHFSKISLFHVLRIISGLFCSIFLSINHAKIILF